MSMFKYHITLYIYYLYILAHEWNMHNTTNLTFVKCKHLQSKI